MNVAFNKRNTSFLRLYLNNIPSKIIEPTESKFFNTRYKEINMKKIIILASLFLSSIAFADEELIRIYNKNPNYSILINYQICALDKLQKASCEPAVKNITLNKGESYKDLAVYNWAFYIKVISAYQIDDQGYTRAQGEFPDEEDCKAFSNHPATLAEKQINKNMSIICIRN